MKKLTETDIVKDLWIKLMKHEIKRLEKQLSDANLVLYEAIKYGFGPVALTYLCEYKKEEEEK